MFPKPQLDPQSGIPLYKQLHEQLRTWIESGRLPQGERLPSTRELAGLIGLNRTTVSACYSLLESDGLIRGHVGRGSFVIGQRSSDAEGLDWDRLLEDGERLPMLPSPAQPGSEGMISFATARPAGELFPLDEIRAACREVLAAFRGLPHRLEWVADLGGVSFYDDSKGTNVGAVATSLAHFDRPVILIAGGRDKDSDFTLISPLIKERVKALVLLGETRDHLAQVWKGLAPICLVANMAEAVRRAYDLARPGEVVLLSPACASFDMFKDYAQRGETFQRLVKELQHGSGS